MEDVFVGGDCVRVLPRGAREPGNDDSGQVDSGDKGIKRDTQQRGRGHGRGRGGKIGRGGQGVGNGRESRVDRSDSAIPRVTGGRR